ncbi:MAG: ribonuclease H-like domain-containing protein [Planctomycetes bacterium]|nr:ribonuclease H-like domain-containing protein [Planctomycetota bacterium]MCB9887404.1 ribonuclease H-like domain-containing protein [Planctomycetota bacterium]
MVAPDRDRLRRAFKLGKASPVPAPAAPAGGMREFLQRRKARLEAGEPGLGRRLAVALPDGEECRSAHGAFWRRELRYPASHVHGAVALGASRHLDCERLAALAKDESFAQLASDECLFLDTETTGLAGGAGTVVFAYGLGFFEGDEFVFEQLFLRDFGEEPALLEHVAARLAQRPVPVTFVGKSYDRHRIHARMAVHKVAAPVLTPRHLDLYHLVRRSHGKVLPDARLRTVEEHLLGLRRHDDLPGSEAPAAFLAWIRDRSGPVDRVLEHNRLDVLSLAALLGVLAGAGGPSGPNCDD